MKIVEFYNVNRKVSRYLDENLVKKEIYLNDGTKISEKNFRNDLKHGVQFEADCSGAFTKLEKYKKWKINKMFRKRNTI